MNVLAITSPLFFLIALGYLGVYKKVLLPEHIPALGRFVLYFAVPGIMLINLTKSTPQELIKPDFMITYGLASVITYFVANFLISRFTNSKGSEASILAMGGAIPNSMFVGLPILLQVMPEHATKVFALCVLVENLLVMPVALFVTEWKVATSAADGTKQILSKIGKRLISNPILLAVAAGLTMSALGLHFPAFIQQSLGMLASGAAATALIMIGGSLVGNSIKGDLRAISTVTLAKLVLHPLIMIAVLAAWGPMDPILYTAAVITAASPMLTVFPVLAGPYGAGKVAASSLLAATVTAYVTLNGFLAFVL